MKPTYLEGYGSKSVVLEPSHEEGQFLVTHTYFGKRPVSEVVLLGVSAEDVESLRATGEFPLDTYVATDERGNSTANVGKMAVSIPFERGSNNSVTTEVESFQEVAPVNAEAPIAA